MAEPETKGAQLQVANARPEDAGRGIARIDRQVMAEIGVHEG